MVNKVETTTEYSEQTILEETGRGKRSVRENREMIESSGAADEETSSEVQTTGAVVSMKAKIGLTRRSSTVQVRPRPKIEISLASLLQAGVHFGHQTSRWCPAMAKYIYTARNGIHILNLPRTVQLWKEARQAIVECVGNGGTILFVGTKKQAQDAIVEEATRCGGYYVSQRWLGGMISNFHTIRRSIDRMAKIEQVIVEEEDAMQRGVAPKYTKKERLMMAKDHAKLDFSLGGIRDMSGVPKMLFVVDIRREEIAIREARKLDIPVVALVDSNCDPAAVDYPIPSNDDGTRAIRLFCGAVADAVLEGREKNAERLKRVSAEHPAGRDKAVEVQSPAPEVVASDFAVEESK